MKTSPVVNTIAPPSKPTSDSNANVLIAELTKEVSDLQRELDSTHAHYQKLLERSGQVDFGPIERVRDATDQKQQAAPAADGDASVQLHSSEKSSSSVQDSKHPASGCAGATVQGEDASGVGGGEGVAARTSSLAKRADKARVAGDGRASVASQEQALQVQIRCEHASAAFAKHAAPCTCSCTDALVSCDPLVCDCVTLSACVVTKSMCVQRFGSTAGENEMEAQ